MKYLLLVLSWLTSCHSAASAPETHARSEPTPELEVIALPRADAGKVAEMIRALCRPRGGAPSGGFCALYPPSEPTPVPGIPLVVEVDARCNTVIVVGSARSLADARDLAMRLDERWELIQGTADASSARPTIRRCPGSTPTREPSGSGCTEGDGDPLGGSGVPVVQGQRRPSGRRT